MMDFVKSNPALSKKLDEGNLWVVMDNASIHKKGTVVNFLREQGVNVLFIPPYRPEYNSVEFLFAKLKNKFYNEVFHSL